MTQFSITLTDATGTARTLRYSVLATDEAHALEQARATYPDASAITVQAK